jgi:hypothetical protein
MNKKVDAIETQLIQIKSRNSTRKSRNSLSVRVRLGFEECELEKF